ncbi:acyl-CoA dehydrogenase family protein [Nocardioides sp. AN3]
MRRKIYDDDHLQFRQMVRQFIEKEVVPDYPAWEAAGAPPRSFYRRLGELGILGIRVPEEYGGGGVGDLKYSAVISEEAGRFGLTLGALRVHTDLVLPYLLQLADEDQKNRWLPRYSSGECMAAIAITEPGAGSDVAAIRTTARLDGDHYVLNGAKTFITGGFNAGLVLVVCRTSPPSETDRRKGLSILLVDTSLPGFSVGRQIDKIGLHAVDTVELSFDNVRVPRAELLGEEGEAWAYLTRNLAKERLSIALSCYAAAAGAVGMARSYVAEREVFGQRLDSFQNTKFVLAECQTQVLAAQTLIDTCLDLDETDDLTPAVAAAAKLFCSEVQGTVIDKCLQLHGGYGYTREYPISRLYADARVTRIYGGTSEVMKSVISKAM